MPISIVVGGQFGSEGKGKVALEIVRRSEGPVTVVRVGGPNSGHTAYDRTGKKWALRQMPAACIDLNVNVVFPAGSYIDVDLFFKEIDELGYPTERIFVSPYANIITEAHKLWERDSSLVGAIGSTGSGVGAAVMAAAARNAANFPLAAIHAEDHSWLRRFIRDTSDLLFAALHDRQRVVIEGSQGFGLSLLDGGYWPKATSRPTTAAAALAEAGLGPLFVDDVTMVLRSFPIRVAGDSGILKGETTWAEIARMAGRTDDLTEFTTVTNKERRVGIFDPLLVKRAINANCPSRIVLNHLDYVGSLESFAVGDGICCQFVQNIEYSIRRKVDWLGFSGKDVIDAREFVS